MEWINLVKFITFLKSDQETSLDSIFLPLTSQTSFTEAGVSTSLVSSRFLNSTHPSVHFGQLFLTSPPKQFFKVASDGLGEDGLGCAEHHGPPREKQNHLRHHGRDYTSPEARSRGISGDAGPSTGVLGLRNRWVPWCKGSSFQARPQGFRSHHLSCSSRSSWTPRRPNQSHRV